MDSGFVPPPPAHLSKRARKIWAERWTDPATRLLFKSTDRAVIERYCYLLAENERDMKKEPAATYETTNTNGDRMIKANPAYSMMLARMRELRAIEQVIGANPDARLNLENKLRGRGDRGSEKGDPATPQSTGAGSATAKPSPLGALKTPRPMH